MWYGWLITFSTTFPVSNWGLLAVSLCVCVCVCVLWYGWLNTFCTTIPVINSEAISSLCVVV